jgi:hypothetical protein
MDPVWARKGARENSIKTDVREKECEDEIDWTGSGTKP